MINKFSDLPAGLTLEEMRAWLLSQDLPNSVEIGSSLEDLALNVERGFGVIAFINQGELLQSAGLYDCGETNCAIFVRGVERDSAQQGISGFWIQMREQSLFCTAETIVRCWLDSGGVQLAID